jgi:hypothetical protein
MGRSKRMDTSFEPAAKVTGPAAGQCENPLQGHHRSPLEPLRAAAIGRVADRVIAYAGSYRSSNYSTAGEYPGCLTTYRSFLRSPLFPVEAKEQPVVSRQCVCRRGGAHQGVLWHRAEACLSGREQ